MHSSIPTTVLPAKVVTPSQALLAASGGVQLATSLDPSNTPSTTDDNNGSHHDNHDCDDDNDSHTRH
jgi:hypothetical protein